VLLTFAVRVLAQAASNTTSPIVTMRFTSLGIMI